MSLISNFENAVKAELIRSEAAVEAIVTDAANGLEVGLADLQGAGNWIAKNAPAIVAGIEGASAFAIGLGTPVSPALLIAAKASVAALDAFATAHNAGQSTPSSVVNGYIAYTTSAGLISQVKATAIQTKAAGVLATIATAANQVAAATAASPSVAAAANAVAGAVTGAPAQ